MKYRTLILIIVISLLLTSCSASNEAVTATNEAVIATKIAEGIEATKQAKLKADIEAYRNLKKTPNPTETPIPTARPAIFDKSTKTLQGYLNTGDAIVNHPEITVNEVTVKPFFYDNTKAQVVVYLSMRNPNQTVLRTGDINFIAIDDNGVAQTPINSREDCDIDIADVMPGGVLKGCIAFAVPDTGHVVIAYAPYVNNKFGDDRIIKWDIKY